LPPSADAEQTFTHPFNSQRFSVTIQARSFWRHIMKEIIFEATEDIIDGGYTASALGYGIHTEADTLQELRDGIREAVDCYFDETMNPVGMIRLHFIRDEVLAP
jgi:hypothetical protein